MTHLKLRNVSFFFFLADVAKDDDVSDVVALIPLVMGVYAEV